MDEFSLSTARDATLKFGETEGALSTSHPEREQQAATLRLLRQVTDGQESSSDAAAAPPRDGRAAGEGYSLAVPPDSSLEADGTPDSSESLKASLAPAEGEGPFSTPGDGSGGDLSIGDLSNGIEPEDHTPGELQLSGDAFALSSSAIAPLPLETDSGDFAPADLPADLVAAPWELPATSGSPNRRAATRRSPAAADEGSIESPDESSRGATSSVSSAGSETPTDIRVSVVNGEAIAAQAIRAASVEADQLFGQRLHQQSNDTYARDVQRRAILGH